MTEELGLYGDGNMLNIAQLFHKQGLRWIYLNCPEDGIWVQRPDRLMALLTLGKLGYRIASGGKEPAENNILLKKIDHDGKNSIVRLVTDLNDFDLKSQESAFWDRKVFSFDSHYKTVFSVLNATDRFLFHLLTLKFQKENTIESWVTFCNYILQNNSVAWEKIQIALTHQSYSKGLLKALGFAASLGVLVPELIGGASQNRQDPQKNLDSYLSI